MNVVRILKIFISATLVFVYSVQALANSTGISGRSGKQGAVCSGCHGGANFNSSIQIQGDTSVTVGSINTFTLQLTHSATRAGFNFAASDGALTAVDSGTRLLNGELTHSSPKSQSGGSTSWTVQWTAPSSAGSETLFVCGNPVNGNSTTTGDESNTPCTTAQITVVAANAAPVTNDDNVSTDEDTVVEIDVLANDTDSDGTIDASTVALVSTPEKGSASVNSSTGAITYTPNDNINGSDSFSYTVQDDQGATSNEAMVSITINAVNDAPIANNDVAGTNENESVEISVLDNDSDIDGSLDTTSVVIISNPSNGEVSVNSATGVVTYAPVADFNGNDTFSYQVSDDLGLASNTASVSVSVRMNIPPVATDDEAETTEDQAVIIDILANDSDDLELDPASVMIVTEPLSGSASVNSQNGSVTYTPNKDVFGDDSFTYRVSDNENAASNDATVTVSIAPVNDAPEFTSEPVLTVTQGQTYTYTITTSDAEGDSVSLSATNIPTWLDLNESILSGVPPIEAIGNNSVIISASDGMDSSLHEFTIEVLERSDADLSLSASASVSQPAVGEDLQLTLTISNNGPATASNVMVEALLHGDISVVEEGSNCMLTSGSPQELSCTAENIENGGEAVLNITVNALEATDIFLSAEVSSSEDPTTVNDKANLSTSIAASYVVSGESDEGASSRHVALGDINGDGFADGIFINGSSENDQVFLNNGAGQFTLASTLDDASDGAYGALADLDNDGDLDLVVANCSDQGNQVYSNDGAGNFTLTASLGSSDSRGVIIIDLDNDGMLDLVFANAGGGSSGQPNTIYMNEGAASFTLTQELGERRSMAVQASDFNNDGLVDLAFANAGEGNTLYYASGDIEGKENVESLHDKQQMSQPNFGTPMVLGEELSLSVAIVDANQDDAMDLVFANSSEPGATQAPANTLYLNQLSSFVSDATMGLTSTKGVISGEFNGDGTPDLMFINAHGAHQFYFGNGTGGFDLAPTALFNSVANQISSADLDGDGDNDLVYADNKAKQNSNLLNDSSGNMSPPSTDIAVSIMVSEDVVMTDDSLTFDITVENKGPLTAQSVVLTHTLPTGLEVSSGLENCVMSGQEYTCSLGDMMPGNMTEITVMASVTLATGDLNYQVMLSSLTQDITTTDNQSSVSVRVNQAPSATNDSASTTMGQAVTINVLSNDTDDDTLDTASLTIVSEPANGAAAINNGNITYTPNSDFTGSDSFTYQVADSFGVLSNIATVNITVASPPPPPRSSSGGGTIAYMLLCIAACAFMKSRRNKRLH